MKRCAKCTQGQQLFHTHLREGGMFTVMSVISTREGSWLVHWLTTENLPSPNHMTQRVPSAARLRPVIHHDTIRPGHQENPRNFPQMSSPIPNPRPSWENTHKTNISFSWTSHTAGQIYLSLRGCKATNRKQNPETDFFFNKWSLKKSSCLKYLSKSGSN